MTLMTANSPVTIYSTPTCPDCRSLKEWLTRNHIDYEEKDLTDPLVVEEARRRTGVRVAPITIIGEEILYGTFAAQRPAIERLLGIEAVR